MGQELRTFFTFICILSILSKYFVSPEGVGRMGRGNGKREDVKGLGEGRMGRVRVDGNE